MSTIEAGFFKDVPDEVPPMEPITPGEYDVEIQGIPTIGLTKKGDHQLITLEVLIMSEGDFQGRKIKDWICLNDFGKVKAKNLFTACGQDPEGDVNLDDLSGCIIAAKIKGNPFKNRDTGEMVMGSAIDKYIV